MHAYWATFGYPGRRTAHPGPFSTVYSPNIFPWFPRHASHSYAHTQGCCHVSSGQFEPWVDSKTCRESSTSGQTFTGTEAQCDYYQPLMQDTPPGELTRDEMMVLACQSGSNQHQPACQAVLGHRAPAPMLPPSMFGHRVPVSHMFPPFSVSTETDFLPHQILGDQVVGAPASWTSAAE